MSSWPVYFIKDIADFINVIHIQLKLYSFLPYYLKLV